ncbi:MAG: hypothetical protein ACHQ1D_00390 [Nitrososphaerales archaeon]
MRTNPQPKIICDLTGKNITNNYGISLGFYLLFKNSASASKNRAYDDNYSGEAIDLDFEESVGIEIFKFLKKKYPEVIKKKLGNLQVISSEEN